MRWRGWASAPAPTRPKWPMRAWRAGAYSRRDGSSLPPASGIPRLKVDIEMLGKGEPRILEWELKTAPFAGIGLLRFHAGTADAARGTGRGRADRHRRRAGRHGRGRGNAAPREQAGEADLGRRQAGHCQRRRHQRRVPVAADRPRPRLHRRRRSVTPASRRARPGRPGAAAGASQRPCSTCCSGIRRIPAPPRSSVRGGRACRCQPCDGGAGCLAYNTDVLPGNEGVARARGLQATLAVSDRWRRRGRWPVPLATHALVWPVLHSGHR